jgi:hypothetical protein
VQGSDLDITSVNYPGIFWSESGKLWKSTVKLAYVTTEIRTGYLLNTSQKSNICINLLGDEYDGYSNNNELYFMPMYIDMEARTRVGINLHQLTCFFPIIAGSEWLASR